jgi:uncharacterized membrane protein YeiH
MLHLLEHFGVAVGAVTGILAARDKRLDLFGVLVLALVAAFGGRTCRDVLLDSHPIFWISNLVLLLNASVTATAFFTSPVFRNCRRRDC